MNTKELKVGDRVQRTAREILKGMVLQIKDYKGTVVQVRDCEPSLGVIWDGYTKIYWYITSSGVFQKIDGDISDEDKDLITDIINNIKVTNDGLPSLEEITSAWKKVVEELESEGELKPKFNCVEMTDENGNKIGEIIPLIGDNFGKGGFEEVVEVGDRVEYIHNCSPDIELGEQGVVVFIDSVGGGADIGVRFDKFDENRHSLLGNCEKGYGYWVFKGHIKKIESDVKNQVLSPKEMLKAGMVVEMGDGDFGLFDGERIIYKDGFDEFKGLDNELQDICGGAEFSIVTIYKPTCGYTLQNLDRRVDKFEVVWKKEGFKRKIKKEFSKDEITILESLHLDGYKYLARDECGSLWAYSDIPEKEVSSWSCHFCDNMFLGYVSKLFKCVSWEDERPIRIEHYI